LLTASAGLKLVSILYSQVEGAGFIGSTRVQFVAIGWELALAFWIWSGRRMRSAWWASIATFTVFACVSFSQAWAGERTCCCFGPLEVQPWLTFGLDFAVLTALVLFCRSEAAPAIVPQPLGWPLVALAFTSILGGIVAAAWREVPARRVAVEGWATLADSEFVCQGTRREWIFLLANVSSEPVQIGEISTSCACFQITPSAEVLAPGETTSALAVLDLSGKPEYCGELSLFATA